VAGDAALYFDPTSVDSIANALLMAYRQPDLLERCRAAAPAQLARFDWPKAARTYVACYRAAAGATLTPEQQALFDEAVAL
jgi:glycogen synthase